MWKRKDKHVQVSTRCWRGEPRGKKLPSIGGKARHFIGVCAHLVVGNIHRAVKMAQPAVDQMNGIPSKMETSNDQNGVIQPLLTGQSHIFSVFDLQVLLRAILPWKDGGRCLFTCWCCLLSSLLSVVPGCWMDGPVSAAPTHIAPGNAAMKPRPLWPLDLAVPSEKCSGNITSLTVSAVQYSVQIHVQCNCKSVLFAKWPYSEVGMSRGSLTCSQGLMSHAVLHRLEEWINRRALPSICYDLKCI